MNTRQNGSMTMVKREFEESVRKIGRAVIQRGGSPRQLFNRIRADRSFADRVAEFLVRGKGEDPISQKLARVIMWKNFWGIEEWMSTYKVNFSNKQLREVAEFPWGKVILDSTCPLCGKVIKECHFAFLGLDYLRGKPLTICRWQKIHNVSSQPRFCSYVPDSWFSKESFANEPTCDFKWYLMHKGLIPISTDKTHQEQTVMIPFEYAVPLAVEEVTKGILYYIRNGAYLNSQRWSRCLDVTSKDLHVCVGSYGKSGFSINRSAGGCRDYRIGLVALRK